MRFASIPPAPETAPPRPRLSVAQVAGFVLGGTLAGFLSALRFVSWPVLLLLRLSFFGAFMIAVGAYRIGHIHAAVVAVMLLLITATLSGMLQRVRGR